MDYIWIIAVVAVYAVMMYFMNRRRKAQQAQVEEFKSSRKVGDQVMTTAGLLGEISAIDEKHNRVTIKSGSSTSEWYSQSLTEVPEVAVIAAPKKAAAKAVAAKKPAAKTATKTTAKKAPAKKAAATKTTAKK